MVRSVASDVSILQNIAGSWILAPTGAVPVTSCSTNVGAPAVFERAPALACRGRGGAVRAEGVFLARFASIAIVAVANRSRQGRNIQLKTAGISSSLA